MSSGIYILPGTQTSFANLESIEGRSKNAEDKEDYYSSASGVGYNPRRSELLGLIPYQLFNPQTSPHPAVHNESVDPSTLCISNFCGWPLSSSPKDATRNPPVDKSHLGVNSSSSLSSERNSDGTLSYVLATHPAIQQKKPDLHRRFLGDAIESADAENQLVSKFSDAESFERKRASVSGQTELPADSFRRQSTGSISHVSSEQRVPGFSPATTRRIATNSNTVSTKAPPKQNSTSARIPTYPNQYNKRISKQDNTRSQSTNSATNALCRSSYMCRKCRAHGKLLPVKQHKRNCPFRNCTCPVCSLVNYGRHIVAKQIALYRDQKNHHTPNATSDSTRKLPNGHKQNEPPVVDVVPAHDTSTSYSVAADKCSESVLEEDGPHCRRCRNHGKNNPWKGHKKTCPYRYCICQQCILISLRKSNEKNLREVVQEYFDDRVEKRDRFPASKSSRQSFSTAPNSFDTRTRQRSVGSAGSVGNYFETLNGQMPFPSFSLTSSHSLLSHSYLSRLTEAYNQTRMVLPPGLSNGVNAAHQSESNVAQSFRTASTLDPHINQHGQDLKLPDLASRTMTKDSPPMGVSYADQNLTNIRSVDLSRISNESSLTHFAMPSQPHGVNFDGMLPLADTNQPSTIGRVLDYNNYDTNHNVKSFDSGMAQNYGCTDNAHSFALGHGVTDNGCVIQSNLQSTNESTSGTWMDNSTHHSTKNTRDKVFRNLVENATGTQQQYRAPQDLFNLPTAQTLNEFEQFRLWGNTPVFERNDVSVAPSNCESSQTCLALGSSFEKSDYQTRAAAFAAAAAAAVAFHQEVAQHSNRQTDYTATSRISGFDVYRPTDGSNVAHPTDPFQHGLCYPQFNSMPFFQPIEFQQPVIDRNAELCQSGSGYEVSSTFPQLDVNMKNSSYYSETEAQTQSSSMNQQIVPGSGIEKSWRLKKDTLSELQNGVQEDSGCMGLSYTADDNSQVPHNSTFGLVNVAKCEEQCFSSSSEVKLQETTPRFETDTFMDESSTTLELVPTTSKHVPSGQSTVSHEPAPTTEDIPRMQWINTP